MKSTYHFTRWAALILLSLSLFTACQQQDKTVKPAAGQMAKLSFLVETLDNADASEADRTKAGQLLSSLTFEEMESLIDLRHEYYLKRSDTDAERAAYLLDLRHKLNRTAFEQKGKPFNQLDFADSEEIIGLVKPGKTQQQYAPGGRTTGTCVLPYNPPCPAWQAYAMPGITPDYIKIQTSGSAAKEVVGTYKGLYTFQCGPSSYQDDCDYVFRYTFSKIYAPAFWRHPIGVVGIWGTASIRMIDNNVNRIDCGTYTMEVMYGKDRIDWNYWTPQQAAELTRLVLNVSIQSLWCYVGTPGSGAMQWYSGGSYVPALDGWQGHPAYPPCACTWEGYKVY